MCVLSRKLKDDSTLEFYKTVADGNCFFHAVFGSRNAVGSYEAEDSNLLRQEWHDYLHRFRSLNDSTMPVALKDQLKKIFLMLINKPSELTGRSHHIAPLADLLKKRHEEIYLQVEQLKLELQEKFKKDLIFQKKLYQALTSYCEITEQKFPDR